jgi:hypothetical protein
MKFLTPELKAYYMSDFTENVLNCKDPFWKLDDNLLYILTNINANQNVQTLYSRRFNSEEDTNVASLLWILVSKNINLELWKEFQKECLRNHELYACKYEPKIKQNMLKHIPIGCMQDNTYFNSGVIQIYINSESLVEHDIFWNTITKYITNL